MNLLTSVSKNTLLKVYMEKNSEIGLAYYDGFQVGNEGTNYKMTFSNFLSGNAGDGLNSQKNM